MLKTTLSILLSCICMAFLLCACEPAENYELAFKQKYIDRNFKEDNYQDESTIKELYNKQQYPSKFNVLTRENAGAPGAGTAKLISVVVATPKPPPITGLETPAEDPFPTPEPFPDTANNIIDPIPGAGLELMPLGTGTTSNINERVIRLLGDMYPENDKPNWSFPQYTDEDVNTAMLRTIMYDPQITARIQRDVNTSCRFRGVLISGSDVILSSIETSGGIYCLGSLFLANGSKVVGDSKYIGDCINLYNGDPLMKKFVAKYGGKLPMNMNSIPQRTELFRYMEVNLEGEYRNKSFNGLATDLAQPDGLRTILGAKARK